MRDERAIIAAGCGRGWHAGCLCCFAEVPAVAAQCAILFVGLCGKDGPRVDALRSLGFRVEESPEIPSPDDLAGYHVVVVRACAPRSLPMLGARMRGKPKFGRRVLLALVAADVSDRDRRDATMCGFDWTLPDTCTARDLAAHVLRLLRAYPEYRCLLRAPNGRRKAA
jgi:hypothetical protein